MEINTKYDYSLLYRVAWHLCLVMLILIPLQMVFFVIVPPPDTVTGFFELYRRNAFLGLVSLDLLYMLNNIIVVIVYLALFMLMRRERPVIVTLALILGLIGVAAYYPSNPAFEMLTLSAQYFQAQPAQQVVYLAAGEALLAGYTGTAFNAYYVLSTICLLLLSYAVIKSPRFGNKTGWWGLASGICMIVPSSAGMLGMIFSNLSLVPWVVFIVLLTRCFRRFAAEGQPEHASFNHSDRITDSAL
jgi:hypothetical protein